MHRDRHSLAYWKDRIAASDPSLDRLRSGARAVLTAGLAAAAFVPLTRWIDVPYQQSLAGSVVPMIAVVALQDAGRRAQQITMAWVPVVATIALVIGSLAAANPWLSGALFLLTIFASFEARRYGARGTGLGTMAYQSFFYALLFKTPSGAVQWTPLFVFTGCAIAWAVHFRIVPERPGRMLRAELRAYRARLRALLDDVARALADGKPKAQDRIDAHVAALNVQSLGLDARLAGFAIDAAAAGTLREQVVRCEIAAETVVAVARADAGAHARLAGRVHALRDGLSHTVPPAPQTGAIPLPQALRRRLDHAARTLRDMQPWRAPLPALRDDLPPAPDPPRPRGSWFDATTRRALQATVSALGAIVAGRAISPTHWYWAVFAAFVVFTRASTVGQTLSGAWRQVLASVAGLGLGVAVAGVVHGSHDVELALLFVFVAVGFYAFRGMQNVYTALLAAMLAMLYELMGQDSQGLLVLRLTETVAGALSAVLAARVVLPRHTNDQSDDRGAALLRAAAGLLRGVDKGGPPAPLHDMVRPLDRALQALRQSLGPVTTSAYPASKAERRRRLDRLARLAFCARHAYCILAGQASACAPLATLGVLDACLEGVARMLEAPRRPAQPGADMARLAPVEATAIDTGDGAAQLLAEADAILCALQAELGAQ